MNRGGFGLIECMIYCLLVALLAVTWMQGIASVCRALSGYSRQCNAMVVLYSAHDLLVRDLRNAPRTNKGWKKVLPTELIWHTNGTDIGWQFIDNQLVRMEGVYQAGSDSWSKRSKSIVATNLEQIQFQANQKGGKVSSVGIRLQGHGHTIERDVWIL